MSQKRQPEDEKGKIGSGVGSPEDKRQKVPAFKQVVMEAIKTHALQKLLSALEPLVRRVVKEEVEQALANHLADMTRECGKEMHPSTSRSLQLQFKNKLSLPIFTGTRIEGEDCSAITIILVDALTGKIVTYGPESSMKVEIVVLEGDFEGNEEENWTFEEFKNNIVKEREGKRSLLTGGMSLDLNEGIGEVAELSFTDNSSWTRSRKFRLGARVADGYFNGMRVREAKSEPFMVKDHRGELYKKHYPPVLGDEVWRLEKIGKDGAFHKRLTSENISTVKDFLTLLCTDAPRLRNILGSGMSAKMWEVTVEHARTCVLTNQMYVHCPNGQIKRGVVFSIVGELMGLLSEQQFVSVNDLSDNEKADAQSLVKLAFEHWNDVIAYDMGAVVGSSSSRAPPNSFLPGSQDLPNNNMYNNLPSPIIKSDGFGYTYHPSISSPDIFTGGFDDAYALQSADSIESRGLVISNDACKDSAGLERMPNTLMLEDCGSHSLFGEDCLHYLDSDISLLSQSLGMESDLGTAVTGFLAMSARSAAARVRAHNGWTMLVSVLRWRFSIKRIVASKKNRIHETERDLVDGNTHHTHK